MIPTSNDANAHATAHANAEADAHANVHAFSAPARAVAAFAEQLLPGEIQYAIDDEGVLRFTPAGVAWWQPLFAKWGFEFEPSLEVDEFEDISTAILLREMQGLARVGAARAGCRAA